MAKAARKVTPRTSPRHRKPSGKLERLLAEMAAISAAWDDKNPDPCGRRLFAVEERIIAIPARSLADVVIKLKMWRRYERDEPPPEGRWDELWEMNEAKQPYLEDKLLLSIARDVHALAGSQAA